MKDQARDTWCDICVQDIPAGDQLQDRAKHDPWVYKRGLGWKTVYLGVTAVRRWQRPERQRWA